MADVGVLDLDRAIAEHTGKQERSFLLRDAAIDEEARTVEVCFASDVPYERWFGFEVLSMDRNAIRSSRLDEGVAVLVNHDTDDQVGVSMSWSLGTDRRMRAVLRFGESARAQEIFRDIVTGIRRQISFGYLVHHMGLIEEAKDGPSTYLVDDYEPFEISIVPIAADHKKAGVGRSTTESAPAPEVVAAARPITEEKRMDDTATPTIPQVDVSKVMADAQRAAEERVQSIMAIGKRHGMDDFALEHVNKGSSVDEFRAAVLEKMGAIRKVDTSPELGLSKKEIRRFSWIRAINALANPNSPEAQRDAEFERELSDETKKQQRSSAKGLLVPMDVLFQKRDMIVGTPADGGYLKGTEQMGDSYIDVLRKRMMVMQMGAREMSGLIGDVAIPRATAGHTGYWVDESTAYTESKMTLGQMALAPKLAGAYSDLSRKLLLQSSPSVEQIVQDDLAATIALTVDAAALHGTGSNNQPYGIASYTGVNTTGVAGGTDGLAPALAHIVGLETIVSAGNADINKLGYLTNSKVRGKLKQTFANTTGGDTPLWTKGEGPGWGELNGYRAGVSNQVSSTLTKGNSSGVCSAIFFGNWDDLVIGMWGPVELLVDPFSLSTSGWVRVVAHQAVDIGIRQVASFAVMLDALTA